MPSHPVGNQESHCHPNKEHSTIKLLWTLRFDATDEYASEFVWIRIPPCGDREGEEMRIDRRFLGKLKSVLKGLKSFLIELTAFVSLLLVLIKIIMVEAHQLFR